MKTPEIYVSRIGMIRDIMREKGIDAVIIAGSDPHSSEYPAERWKQVQWVCGFTGEAGDVVITLDHAGLWTDTRYFIQAVEQLEGTGVELHKTRIPGEIRIPQWLAEYAFEGDVRHVTVAVDGLAQTVDSVENLKNAFRKAGRIEMGDGDNSFSIIDLPDMLENVWIDRPSVPSTEIYRLPDEVAGESRQSRLQWLRDFIDENNCSAMLVTALDEIVWLLNVRASDVAYNPVALSYLLVTWDKAVWYVDKAGEKSPVTAETYAELEEDGVEIRSYDAVFEELASPEALNFTALYVDPSTLNWHLSSVLDGISDRIRLAMGASPVPLRKSVKNTVEIEGMRSAHFEDGIVMENFLFWLEKTVSSGAVIDEWDAACKLDSMRAAVPGCKGNSFETISAYGPGAALPHYVTPHTGSAVLEPHGLYLCKVKIPGNQIVQDLQLIFGQVVFCDANVLCCRKVTGESLHTHKRLRRVGPVIDNLRCGVAVGRIVQLVLHDFEKHNGIRAFRVIVHAGCVEVEYLTIQDLFRRSDVPDPVKQFFPVVPASKLLQPLIVHREAFDHVLLQALRCPSAELCAANGLDTVAHRDDHIQIIVVHLIGFAVCCSCCKICNN